MTMPKNYMKQVYLLNEPFSSYVALRICFLSHLVHCHYKIDLVFHFVEVMLAAAPMRVPVMTNRLFSFLSPFKL